MSLQWISEKYDELRPYIQLFPISTASFILGLLLRVLEKVEYHALRILIAALVLPFLWLTFLHSSRANQITFFQIGLQHESVRYEDEGKSAKAAKTNLLEQSSTLPFAKQNERTPLLGTGDGAGQSLQNEDP